MITALLQHVMSSAGTAVHTGATQDERVGARVLSQLHQEEQRVRRIASRSLQDLTKQVKVVAAERVLLSRIFDAGFISLVRRAHTRSE